jgi:5-keto-L-gluconate epimerase
LFTYSITASLENISNRSPVVLRGDIEYCAQKASKHGYDALELHLKNPKNYDGHKLKKTADKYGVKFSAIATGMEFTINGLSLIDDDSKKRKEAVDRLKEHIDLCQILNCLLIIGIMRSNIRDFDQYSIYEKYLLDNLNELSDYAEKKNVIIVFESITRYINNYLNTVQETTDFLKKINKKNLLMHIDTHSMNIEDVNLAESVKYCADTLGYVHYSDSNRMYPGAGHVNFRELSEVLKEIDYKGYIGIECLPLPDEDSCCDLAFKYVKSIEP